MNDSRSFLYKSITSYKNKEDNLKELIFGSAKSLHGRTLILYQGCIKGAQKLPYNNFANISEAETIGDSQLAY